MPDIGEVFEVDGYKFKVQSMRGQRISLVRVIASCVENEDASDEADDDSAGARATVKRLLGRDAEHDDE